MTILLVVILILEPQNLVRWSVVLILLDMVSLGLIILNRKGYLRVACFIFVGFFTLLIFVLAWTAGGIRAPAIQSIPLIVLLAGLMIDSKVGLFTGLISILGTLGLLLAEYFGVLPANSVGHNSISIWAFSTACIALISLLQFYAVESLNKSIRDARQELFLRKNSESRLKSISNNFTAGMIYQVEISRDGKRKFTYLSDSVMQLYGISPEEGMADSSLIYNRVHEDDIESLIKAEEASIKAFSVFKTEVRMKNPTGEIRWSSFVSTPKLTEEGSIYFDGIEFIITERKQLEEQTKLLKDSIDIASDAAFWMDTEGQIIYVNTAACKELGYTMDELLQMKIFAINPRTNAQNWAEALLMLRNTGYFTTESVLRRKDGSQFPVEIASTYLIYDNKEYVNGFARNISGRKLAEEALQESEAKLRAMFESSRDAIGVAKKGIHIYANPSYLKLFGFDNNEQIVGSTILNSIAPGHRQQMTENLHRRASGEAVASFYESRGLKVDGTEFDAEFNVSTYELNGEIYSLANIRDITERKNTEEKIRKSEEKFSKLFLSSPDAILLSELTSGKIDEVNDSFVLMSGYSKEEVIGSLVGDLKMYSSEERQRFVNLLREQGNIRDIEFTLKRKTGELFYVLASAELIEIEGKTHIITNLRDITERKKVQEELKTNQVLIQGITDQSPDIIYIFDLKTLKNVFINKNLRELLGYHQGDVPEESYLLTEQLMHPEDSAQFNNYQQQVDTWNRDYVKEFEYRLKDAQGEWRWFLGKEKAFQMQDNKIISLIGVVSEITLRKKAEIELIESQERYKRLSEATFEGIVLSKQGQFIDVNDQFCSIYGYLAEEIKTIGIKPLIHPDDVEMVLDNMKNKYPGPYEHRGIKKDGTVLYLEVRAQTIFIDNEPHRMTIIRDISNRKLVEIALKESEERYRKLIEAVPDMIILTDLNKNILYGNGPFERITGVTPNDYRNPNVAAHIHPDDQKMVSEAVRDLLTSNKTHTGVIENRFIDSWGNLHWFSGSIAKLNLNDQIVLQTFTRDITENKILEKELENHRYNLELLVKERTEELEATNEELVATNDDLANQKEELRQIIEKLKETQEKLIESEKMASIGILTAGVAHEINNPLNFIQSGIYNLETFIKNQMPLRNEEKDFTDSFTKVVNSMKIGVTRVNEIITGLNHFSRSDTGLNQNCSVHQIIDNCLLILNHEFKNKCLVFKNFCNEKISVLGNEGKLHQVFLNILINAVQSIESEGNITISTSCDKNSKTIQIKIQDSGAGIAPENLGKIFDPFFTTKNPGKGTGLGLSIVYNIIKEHRGTISYKSEAHKGTEVTIELPSNML
jgi:PAS domain S-box-containing protein